MFKLHNTLLWITLGLLIFTTGCRKTIEFDVDHQTKFTVESSLNTPISFPTPEITTNSEQTFENHDTRAELVEEVKLTKLTLKITDPDDETFSFLNDIYISINTQNESKTEVAFKENIPDKVGDFLKLDLTESELSPYLKASEYTIHTEHTTDETLSNDVRIRADMTFHVKAKKELF